MAKALHKRLGADASELIEVDEISITIGRERCGYIPDRSKTWYWNVSEVEELLNKETLYDLKIQKVCELTTKAIDEGKHVIIEACGIGSDCIKFLHENCNVPTLLVLAYCPVLTLIEHGNARNNSGLVYNSRDIDSGLFYFDKLFKPHKVHHQTQPCGTLSRQELNDAYDILCDEFDFFHARTILQRINELKLYFGLFAQEEVSLLPCLPFDLIIDTSKHTADECAESIEVVMQGFLSSEALQILHYLYFEA